MFSFRLINYKGKNYILSVEHYKEGSFEIQNHARSLTRSLFPIWFQELKLYSEL